MKNLVDLDRTVEITGGTTGKSLKLPPGGFFAYQQLLVLTHMRRMARSCAAHAQTWHAWQRPEHETHQARHGVLPAGFAKIDAR